MYTRRPTDPTYCACCAEELRPGQLVWAGLMYDTTVLVCNLGCLYTLQRRWAPTPWTRRVWKSLRRAWARLATA